MPKSILEKYKWPVATCAGELEVFSSLEENIIQMLPNDSAEWKRSMGRPVKSVRIGARFTPFSPLALPKESQWDLIRQPIFHIYWTECSDIETYKTSVRDDIDSWFKELTAKNITDWMIVLVENYDVKKSNKLLSRTTVLDKIRAEFASKQGDRCISVINSGKSPSESKSAESWRSLLVRIRHLLLVAYNRAVIRLEDYVRQQRERRNEPGWDFIKYFQLQEELAIVLEMLGLYDEALVQYDELDALFSQFVVNCHMGESAQWLSQFQKPLESWHGLRLDQKTLCDSPSLLDFRSYLFARQAHLLLLHNNPWEVASRCLPFLHACVQEMHLLEVQSPIGALPCWLFLSALEVLQICDKSSSVEQIDSFSLYTAGLRTYASQKLLELGKLCGQMPGDSPTSEQIHLLVGLSVGMGDSPSGKGQAESSTDKLKEILGSQESFTKNYLELAEYAMGTYKHIGRLRMARLLGVELAPFYMSLGEGQTAIAFLNDALKTLETDGWHDLRAQILLELSKCYRRTGNASMFARCCAAVAAAPEMDTLVRCACFEDMQGAPTEGKDDNKADAEAEGRAIRVPFEDVFRLVSVELKEKGAIIEEQTAELELAIESDFPKKAFCSSITVSLVRHEGKASKNLTNDEKKGEPFKLRFKKHFNSSEDGQLNLASVKQVRKPDDKIGQNEEKREAVFFFETKQSPAALNPGTNVVSFGWKSQTGNYSMSELCIKLNRLEFVHVLPRDRYIFSVEKTEPKIEIIPGESQLLTGLELDATLVITIGSFTVDPNQTIVLQASEGLTMALPSDEEFSSTVRFALGVKEPFSRFELRLRLLAAIGSKGHSVSVDCPWSGGQVILPLSFTPPFSTSWRLQTAKCRKFVQITLAGQCAKKFELSGASLDLGENTTARSVSPHSSKTLNLSNKVSASFIWELDFQDKYEDLIRAKFSIDYRALDDTSVVKRICLQNRSHRYEFNIFDYRTLYQVEARVEPSKSNDFCRVGALCHLHLSLINLDVEPETSVMYEVLAEQSVWAVCGRTTGVVSLGKKCAKQQIVSDVMPLCSGFLPLPIVQLSRYIPAKFDKEVQASSQPKLESFSPGQVYNSSKGQQIHVLPQAFEN